MTKLTLPLVTGLLAAVMIGCSSTPKTYTRDGITYREDEDIQGVWLAEGFDFNNYDTVYVAEPTSTAQSRSDEERQVLSIAKRTLRQELANALSDTGVFKSVTTSTNDIAAGSKVLTVHNEIYHHEKGGGGARFWVGAYGGGQPVIKVSGNMASQNEVLFRYLLERSGESAGSRMGGAFLSDEEIQTNDVKDLARDLAKFVNQTARKLPRK